MTEEYMPGAFMCDKCGLALQGKRKNDDRAGGIEDFDPDEHKTPLCPEDGTEMRPMTWAEANHYLFQALMMVTKERDDLQARLDAAYVPGAELQNPRTFTQ